MSHTPARIVLADHHALFRAAMRVALDVAPHLQVVGEAADGSTALEQADRLAPDVVVVDAALPGLDGLQVCAALSARGTPTRTLLVGERPDERVLLAALEAGADGYVAKEMDLGVLVTAVRQVASGETAVPGTMLGSLLRTLLVRHRQASAVLERFNRLTRREREVLELLVEGCNHETAADILVISPQTARTHIQNVISKLGVHSRLEAAAVAMEYGLVAAPARRP